MNGYLVPEGALTQDVDSANPPAQEAPGANRQITVLIVEDFPLTARGLQATIQDMEECRLAGVAATAEEARRLARAAQPDVITLDIRLGGSSTAGIQLARDLRTLAPNSHVLVCSGFAFEGDVTTLVDVGIDGYVMKGEPQSVVAAAIRALAAGQTFFSRPVSHIIQRIMRGRRETQGGGAPLLGPDEVEILRLVAGGLTNEEIAHQLSVSRPTATRRLAKIFRILEVTNRAEAVAKAAQLGYLDAA
ncbi:MAG: response regulator transcription factor [Chloroflexi bacterium]|nr:response regulator transcription factor [Chloroflexota bacterium]